MGYGLHDDTLILEVIMKPLLETIAEYTLVLVGMYFLFWLIMEMIR